jgi:hypothetical protein
LQGKKQTAPHTALYWRFGAQMAIRKGNWVLVRPSRGTKEYQDIASRPMLFNLAKDIGQHDDVAAQEPALVRDLQADWDRWNAEQPAAHWPPTLGGKAMKLPL